MNPWMDVIGWTLIHFVWQGGLIAFATAAGLRLCRHYSPETRYAIACLGLTAMVAAPAITAAAIRPSPSTSSATTLTTPSASGVIAPMRAASSDNLPLSATRALPSVRLDALLSFVVWAWLAGVTVLLVRFAGGCWRVHRLRIASLEEAASSWQPVSERLAARLRVNVAFRVVESGLVDAPGVIGVMRPVILLPIAVLTSLTPVQIEAILAHELAHIRRRDYAVNLLQTLAETLLFYHPGVWWVSSTIREEREHCCDDVAVESCGEPAAYAAALAELASWRSGETALAVGATDGPLLARVRRLLRVPASDEPRPVGALMVLALSTLMAAGATLQSSAALRPSANMPAATAAQAPAAEWRVKKTDHFDIHYQPQFDLHAERVGQEAERAYARVSADLKHDLGFRVPIVLVGTTGEIERRASDVALNESERILLAMDRRADEWQGIITHEVAHVFGFDILPGTATPRWILEGLAEYERGSWDPADLVALRDAVRANAIPKMSGLQGNGGGDPRLVSALGHAAFDFIESRAGKAGIRQFMLSVRQNATNGGDPYRGAFQMGRDEFDQTFERYLRGRLTASARQSPAEAFDLAATVRIEGRIATISFPVQAGLACMELVVETEERIGRRWAVECGEHADEDVMRALKLDDRVIVAGAPARQPGARRIVMRSLARPSDGLTWRAH